MTAQLGHALILTALLASVVGSALSFAAVWVQNETVRPLGRRAAFLTSGLTISAALVMVYALFTHDFSVWYVAHFGSRETPLYFTLPTLWSALEGSILFWAALLSGYTAVFLWIYRDRFVHLQAGITGILLAISAFFLYVIEGPANPFRLISHPLNDGPGTNPLLQNHWMAAVHPPLLYLGYVGLAVPFAIAMSSLLRGTPDADTLQLIRRWALIPWVFLSLAIVAGMWWAYAVLGWGGYWGWDPVENVSVMPWLVTTAFLHSLQVQQRRGMLKTWTLSLIVAAFLLTMLGTMLTRGGVLKSVHSFTASPIGPLFLKFFAVVLVLSLGLVLARSKELEAPGSLDATICRETVFLLNNLMLVALTFTILLGTLFPLIAQAAQGSDLSVGAQYFDHITVPIGFALLFLMGVGPALPWGASRLEDLQYRFLPGVAVGVVAVLVLLVLGVRGVPALVTFGVAAFVLVVTLERVVADVRIRHGNSAAGWLLSTRLLFRANPRRYGGFLAHIGVLVIAAGIAASQTYGVHTSHTIHLGQTASVQGYNVKLVSWFPHPESNRMVLSARVHVTRSGQNLGELLPSQNYYPALTVVTPAVREEPVGMILGLFSGHSPLPDLNQLLQGRNPFEDLYLVLGDVHGVRPGHVRDVSSTATIEMLVNPMVGLVWFGGVLLGLGGIWALVPAKRRRRVMVDAAAPALVPARAEEATA